MKKRAKQADRKGKHSRVGTDARALRELIEISRAVGDDPDQVQGGGGNTSVKPARGNRMYVKASGSSLAEMDENRGWVAMDLEVTRALLDRPELGKLPADRREAEVLRLLEGAVLEPRGARPSVESSLHALLGRVVIHTHPVGLNAFLAARRSREMLAKFLGSAAPPTLYIPYVDPGYTLALRAKREIGRFRERTGKLPQVVLLENHGLFVSAPDVAGCLELTRRVTARGRRWIGGRRVNPPRFEPVARGDRSDGTPAQAASVRGALLRGGSASAMVRRDDAPEAAALAGNPRAVARAARGAFTPDQIVYCRTRPVVLRGTNPKRWPGAVGAFRERYRLDPRVVVVPGDGVYYAAPDLSQVKVVAEVYRSAIVTVLRSPQAGGPRFLTRRQADFIEGWEVEHYRARKLAGTSTPLEGRIAAVTGAASGLGRGIARSLGEAGATVVGLDVDRGELEQAASDVAGNRFLPVFCDVIDEDSVEAAFRTVEASLGGLDYLVNAAGIAPSHALVDFPLRSWRKTLDINLTGYFLCAREAARLLLRQDAGGAIVNITSKSGLDASKDNSAYNATKAGEIHLMRGWALELGPSGIRVNCVAPGNVFKGSRIWNAEYIRACARKKGLRSEEVIPYYTSLTPLGQEIEPGDVGAAVIFLLSEEARNITGQTLVVDGGQVMVR